MTETEKQLLTNTPITENLFEEWKEPYEDVKVEHFPHPQNKNKTCTMHLYPMTIFHSLIENCEALRRKYLETKDEKYFYYLMRLLPRNLKQLEEEIK